MTPRDFFRLILKIFALLIIVNGVVPAISNIFTWFGTELYLGFIVLGLSLIFGLLAYFVIVKSDWIIDAFRLDRGYDSDYFEFGQPHEGKIIRLACILVGLYLAFESLPMIFLEAMMYFKLEVSSNLFTDFNINSEYFLLEAIIKFFFGLILVASRNQITKLFISKPKN